MLGFLAATSVASGQHTWRSQVARGSTRPVGVHAHGVEVGYLAHVVPQTMCVVKSHKTLQQ